MSDPRRIGRYTLLREIASGGMASVHLGRADGASGFARPVAIKRLHPHYAKDPHFSRMFLDEARMASRIQHPNVVQTIDVVADDGELFLVMELVHGASLSTLFAAAVARGEGIAPGLAVAVMSGALEGLHAAHAARGEDREPLGIVHRDVSPQNILVGSDGCARVVDFGVAKAAGRAVHTAEGQLKGKIAYMPPEQLRGEELDRRADVYAASVVLWEALTGRRLYTGEPTRIMYDVLDVVPPVPSSVRADVPGVLDALVMRGLEKRREDRFATASEMAQALEATGLAAPASEVAAWAARDAEESLARGASWLGEATTIDPEPPAGDEDVAKPAARREDPRTATGVTLARESTDAPGRARRSRARLVVGLVASGLIAGGGIYAGRRWLEARRDSGAGPVAAACGGAGAPCCAGACALPSLACAGGTCSPCVKRLFAGATGKVACAVTRDGKTWCWGANTPELIGVGLGDFVTKPVELAGIHDPAALVFGARTAMAVVGGRVTGWGENVQGILGTEIPLGEADLTHGKHWLPLGGVTSLTFSAFPFSTACATASGDVSCWGSNFASALGNPAVPVEETQREPARVTLTAGAPPARSVLLGGLNAACATTEGGGAYCWGNLTPWILSVKRTSRDGPAELSPHSPVARLIAPAATHVAPSMEGVCVLDDGVPKCHGTNRACVVRAGDREHKTDVFERRAMPATFVYPAKDLAAGHGHYCVIDGADALYCWGANDKRQAGNGAPGDRAICDPQKIDLGAPVIQMALGAQLTCALTEGGVVRCFGANEGAILGEPAVMDGVSWSDAKPIPIACPRG